MFWYFAIFISMILLGFPIYFGLTGASLIYFILNSDVSMFTFLQKQINAPNSFTLIAVPFFILSANIMNKSGITNRIFNFCNAFVGHFYGGLGYVNILASMIFAGMSGAATADAGGLGLIEIKSMREAGYDDDFTMGVTAASSTIGPIIPPSIPMVIYGALTNVSIGALFTGGIVPGLLMGLALSILVFFFSKKRKYPRNRKTSFKEKVVYFKDSFFALLTPLIILGGIWGGIVTPTEAAFLSILYALLVSFFIYKSITLADIPSLLLDTIKLVVPAIILVCGASVFGWIMVYERIDQLFVNAVFNITKTLI